MAVLHHAASADPSHAVLQRELGQMLLVAGRIQEALPWLDRAVSRAPTDAVARLVQGKALEQLGWTAQAVGAFQHAVVLAPRMAEAHARLGIVLTVQDQRAAAAQAFRRAAALEPQTSLGRLSHAYALLAEGQAEQALAALRRLVTIEPSNAPAHVELGKLLAEAGQGEAARTAFERAIKLNPRAPGHYYDLVRIAKLKEADRPLLERMAVARQRADLPELQAVMLELAIGKAHDDLGEPAEAMQHFLAANQRKARLRPLARDEFSARIDTQISWFTSDRLRQSDPGRSEDGTPLLIVGMPRSGTTLIESILACHEQVAAGEELQYWGRRGRELTSMSQPPQGDELRDLAAQYLAILRGISEAPRVTDKKPDNFIWVGLVLWAFPNARIVHCKRNPLDTCTSIMSNFFAPRPDFSTDPDDLVYYYNEYERIMAHWRQAVPTDRFLEIDYEALVASPELEVRKLLDFCRLPWDEACLHPERSARRVTTASLWQVRQPISNGSVGRWRRYEPWLGALNALKVRQESLAG